MTKQLIVGKAVSIKDLKTALDKSYSAKTVKDGFGDFQVDPSLTTRETQTYVNPNTNQVLVVLQLKKHVCLSATKNDEWRIKCFF